MIILLHILIALASVGVASFVYFKPTVQRLVVSYGLIIATVASGTYLIVAGTGDIVRSCLTGLFYVTVVSVVTIATHVRAQKLAKAPVDTRYQ